MAILSTSEHAESHCSAEIGRYQLVNSPPLPIKLEIQSKTSQNCSGQQGTTQQAGPSTKSRTIQHFLHDEGFCLTGREIFLHLSDQQIVRHTKWFFLSYSLSHSSTFKKGLDTGSGSASASVSTSRFCLTHTILLNMAASGVDNGYSRRSAEIRKPWAIRRGAKEGLQHSIMRECGPN